MLNVDNIDFLSVAVAVAGTVLLGAIVYLSNQNSATNKRFLLFALVTAVWGSINYLSYNFQYSDTVTLWMLRFVLFTAVWQAYFLYKLLEIYPRDIEPIVAIKPGLKKWLIGLPIAISLFTFSPFVFPSLDPGSVTTVPKAIEAPGIAIFGLFNVIIIICGLRKLFLTLRNETGNQKNSIKLFLTGILIAFSLIVTFNFIFPVAFGNRDFIPLGALFILPLIIFPAYAALKHEAFHAKAIFTGIFIFFIIIVLVVDVIFSNRPPEFILALNTVKFLTILALSLLLIKGVINEIKQREEIQLLAKKLEKANTRLKKLDRLKSEFVSIASHQLRSPLTAIKGYASLILEGSFGQVNDSVKEAVQKMFDSSSLMAVSVQDFLDVSRIEQGRMKYNFEKFDLEKLLTTVVEELTPVAKEKDLLLTLKITSEHNFEVSADLGKIKQVLYNLIDNSIKYTPEGSVNVLMHHIDGKIRIEIHDTGVGIAPETLPKLFDKFVRSRNAHHVNVSGTGLGLFVVKQMVEAHKGRVWATSPGAGEGSTFHIDLPQTTVN